MRKNSLFLLLVEDDQKHLEQAKEYFAKRPAGIVKVDYASSLEEALLLVKEKEYDGIITDVFFPRFSGGEPELNGVRLASKALREGIPVVLVTDTYHHGRATGPACRWCRCKRIFLLDSGEYDDFLRCERKGPVKFWRGAFLVIVYLIVGKKMGVVEISPAEIKGVSGIAHKILMYAEDYLREGKEKIEKEYEGYIKGGKERDVVLDFLLKEFEDYGF
jgi:CheY-like chemotaxis protein